MTDLGAEIFQRFAVTGDGVVVEVFLNHPPQPSSSFLNRPVAIAIQDSPNVSNFFS